VENFLKIGGRDSWEDKTPWGQDPNVDKGGQDSWEDKTPWGQDPVRIFIMLVLEGLNTGFTKSSSNQVKVNSFIVILL